MYCRSCMPSYGTRSRLCTVALHNYRHGCDFSWLLQDYHRAFTALQERATGGL
jgi:hypothetical protein